MRLGFCPPLHDFACFTCRLCGIRLEFREILSRIPVGFESRQNHGITRNPGVGISSQKLIHPSYLCQIGAVDQGLIFWTSNRQPLPHGSSSFSSIRLSEASIKSTTDVLNPDVHHRRRRTGKAFDMPSLPARSPCQAFIGIASTANC